MTWSRVRAALRSGLATLLHRPEEPVFVDTDELTRKRQIREAEFQAAVDAASGIGRTSRQCRQMERRQVAGIIERGKA